MGEAHAWLRGTQKPDVKPDETLNGNSLERFVKGILAVPKPAISGNGNGDETETATHARRRTRKAAF